MDKEEAQSTIERQLARYRKKPYAVLIRLLEKPDDFEVTAPSGKTYQLEVSALWDYKPDGNLRIIVSIDDGSLRTMFHPLTGDFIMQPDGHFVDE